MLTEQETKSKRYTKIHTVYTLTKELAQEYIKQSYSNRKNLVIHNVMPSSYAGYDVCFSHEVD